MKRDARSIPPDAQAELRRSAVRLVGKNPDQLKLPGFLGTRQLVADLISKQFGVSVGADTAGAVSARVGDVAAEADAACV